MSLKCKSNQRIFSGLTDRRAIDSFERRFHLADLLSHRFHLDALDRQSGGLSRSIKSAFILPAMATISASTLIFES
jgi:hypothetical protein